ncbi:acyl-CoA carboxylase subunit beta [Rhodococcus wratislaviensis]|uniref:acyl-CoA carboxylase subunit beta n=1 Tax=Rhodococcus wratislaviensis TaxID=44752 RepID=UPI00351974FA
MGFSWDQAVAEITRRRALSRQLGGQRRIDRTHEQGRFTIRERIDRVATRFYEIGEFATFDDIDAGGRQVGQLPSSYVCGLADVNGRPIALGGEDFTVRAGAPQSYLDRFKGGFGGFVEDLAHHYRIPLLMFSEGVGGDVAAQAEKGHSYLVSSLSWKRCFGLMSEVPVVSIVSGVAAGGTAGRAVLSHFSVMTKDSSLFAGGPPLVKRALGRDISKEELGGAPIVTGVSGAIDNMATDEDDAIAQALRFLSYMPQNVWELPPVIATDDPIDRRADELLSIIPENRRQPYKVRALIAAVVDRDSFFEIGGKWGRSVTTGLARIGGIAVGVVANDPMHLGGALDAAAAEKQIRFVDMCSTFHLPILYFVDVPGFMIGPEAERGSVIRWGMRAIQSIIEAEVPVVTIHVRKAYGMAVSATSNPDSMQLRLAWPSAEWGDLPIEGGVEAGFHREIEAADDPAQFRASVEARMLAMADIWKTVEAFGIEQMIDPRETREMVAVFVRAALTGMRTKLGPQARQWTMRL